MKKLLKILGILIIIIIGLVIIFIIQFIHDSKIQEEDQKLMIKTDEELIGQHLYIKRDNKNDVDVNIYIKETDEKLPLVINIHGGAFIAGDADTLDTQSDRISNSWNVHVATVNYSLLKNGVTKEYAIEEIKDTVKYFIENKDKYNVDINNIFIMGYSAGGYYAMASTLELTKENIPIKGQILCYAFLSDMLDVYEKLDDVLKKEIPNALFIYAGDEPVGGSSSKYENILKENGVKTTIKTYDNVKHGFIEENNPEYEKLHKKNRESKSPEAETIAREAEDYINEWIKNIK